MFMKCTTASPRWCCGRLVPFFRTWKYGTPSAATSCCWVRFNRGRASRRLTGVPLRLTAFAVISSPSAFVRPMPCWRGKSRRNEPPLRLRGRAGSTVICFPCWNTRRRVFQHGKQITVDPALPRNRKGGSLRRDLPRQQGIGRTNADGLEITANAVNRKGTPVSLRLARPRLKRTQQHDVAAEGVPYFHVRKNGTKRPQHQRGDAVVHFINMKPLRHDAAGPEAAPGQLVVFLAEHAAHADRPRIGRLGDDHVVSLRMQFENRARILVPDAHTRVVEDARSE